MAPIQRTETGLQYPTIPPYDHDPYAMAELQAHMHNSDPTNEYMYQLPPRHQSENNQLDLQKLNERLRFLNLTGASDDALPTAHLAPADQLQSGFQSPNPEVQSNHYYRKFPSTSQILPEDSISMYRPTRRPAESVRSGRQGGTNVDPADGDGMAYQPSEPPDMVHDGRSFAYTAKTPVSSSPELEPITPGPPTGLYNTGSVQGDMMAMRDRLLRSQSQRQVHEGRKLARKIDEASQLAAAFAKLEAAQDQVRTLQATLIAEQVARHQLEDASKLDDNNFRECRNELSTAIRALRRSREEQRRTDEERRKIARGFEQVKAQLHRYHEELQIREARAKGREEGRAEAWQEAERWMGQSPPLPTEPIQSIPDAVFRQTTVMGGNQPMPSVVPLQNVQGQGVQRQYQSPGQQTVSPPTQQQYQVPPQAYQQTSMPETQYPPQAQMQPGPQPQMQAGSQPQPGIQQMLDQYHQQRSDPSPLQHPTPGSFLPQYNPQATQRPTRPQQTEPTYSQPMQRSGQQPMYTQQPGQTREAPVPQFQGDMPRPPPGSLSVPQRSSAFPHQHQRTATLDQTQPNVSASTHAPPSSSLNLPEFESMPRPTAADSYLDRVEHDSNLKDILAGARSRTLDTSGFPNSVKSIQGMPNQVSEDRGTVDKPLPNPFRQPHQSGLGRSHSTRPSRAGTMASQPPQHRGPRRMSLSDGLHAHSHLPSQVPDGDRYPAFPHAGGQHSRNSSYASIDPARFALPASGIASMVQSPHNHINSVRQTPQSRSTRSRSRMAGALRNEEELEPELSAVDEAEEDVRLPPADFRAAPQTRSDMQPEAYSTVMRNVTPKQGKPPQIKKAPSMPMRWQPMPVMPTRLGKALSETHSRQPTFGWPPAKSDPQNRRQTFDAGHSRKLSVPPQLSQPQPPMDDTFNNGSGGGPRYSALGLEGIESMSRAGTTRAPTITVQPPSTNNLSVPHSRAPQSTAYKSRPLGSHADPSVPEDNPLPIDPRDYPLPASKSAAPTIYASPPEPEAEYPLPHKYPLPPSRSVAPTAYTFSPKSVAPRTMPNDPRGMHKDTRDMPQVSMIDYAIKAPLPDSRATTMLAATVINEADTVHVPTRARQGTTSSHGKARPVDPRQYPLPPSRAPSHRPRASTYARTEGTIDEVTEEESGREGGAGRHRR